jgi:hypothetical protein
MEKDEESVNSGSKSHKMKDTKKHKNKIIIYESDTSTSSSSTNESL